MTDEPTVPARRAPPIDIDAKRSPTDPETESEPCISSASSEAPAVPTASQAEGERPAEPPFGKMLTPEHVAEILGVTPQLLGGWRRGGLGPRYLRLSPAVFRYREADVREFLEACSGTPAAKPPS